MTAYFDRFLFTLTRTDAGACSHQGACDAEVAETRKRRYVQRQFSRLDPDAIRAELRAYGAWDAEELADDNANQARLIWIAAGNINEAVAS